MIAIVVLVVLAWMVAGSLAGYGTEGKIGATKAQVASFQEALELFRADCGRYPTTAENLDALRTRPPGAVGWRGPYVTREIPLDPWGIPYRYVFNSARLAAFNGNVYGVWSSGPDGVDRTLDDVCSWNIH
jgi:general secretion pathway protein G